MWSCDILPYEMRDVSMRVSALYGSEEKKNLYIVW